MKIGGAGGAVAAERANGRRKHGGGYEAVAVIRDGLRGVDQFGAGIGKFDGPDHNGRFAPVELVKCAEGNVRPVLGVTEKQVDKGADGIRWIVLRHGGNPWLVLPRASGAYMLRATTLVCRPIAPWPERRSPLHGSGVRYLWA